MISTSFLRTLSLKRYQDFAEENMNRLKVFYIRTVNKINKETKLKKIKPKIFNKCNCKNKSKSKRIDIQDHQQFSGQENYCPAYFNNESVFKRIRPVQSCFDKCKSNMEPKKIIMDFESARVQCESKLQRMEKQIFLQSRKLALRNINNKKQRKQLASTNAASSTERE